MPMYFSDRVQSHTHTIDNGHATATTHSHLPYKMETATATNV